MSSLFFSLLWVFFGHLDPDPADQNQCGSASTLSKATTHFLQCIAEAAQNRKELHSENFPWKRVPDLRELINKF
jgi:hypothetical protein